MFGIGQVGRITGLRVCEYPGRVGAGLLVSSGTGLMMALMDAAPSLHWCVDLDTSNDDRAKEMFLRLVQDEADPIVIAGWWSISNPAPVRAALADYRRLDHVLVHANVPLCDRVAALGLDELIARLRERPIVEPPPTTVRVQIARGT